MPKDMITKKDLERLIREGKVHTVHHVGNNFSVDSVKNGMSRANVALILQHAPITQWRTIRTLTNAKLIGIGREEFVFVKWLDTQNGTLYCINNKE